MTETPGDKKKGEPTVEQEFEQRFDDIIQPVSESNRPTPIIPDPSPPPPASVPSSFVPVATPSTAPDSQKPTEPPGAGVDLRKLFSLSNPSNPPSDPSPQRGVVVKEVADVMAGTHPGLKPSPVPQMYVERTHQSPLPPHVFLPAPPPEADAGPEIEVTSEEEMDTGEFEGSSEPAQEKLSPLEILHHCLTLYREMHIDFSAIQRAAAGFHWKKKRLTDEQITFVVLHFLNEMTHLFARRLLEKKMNTIQTKMGKLSEELLLKMHGADQEDAPVNLQIFSEIKKQLETVPADGRSLAIAEDFIQKTQFADFFTRR